LERTADKNPVTFTDMMRVRFKGVIDPIAGFLNRLGIKPNTVTYLGLIGNAAGAALVAFGYITWGGVVVLLTAPFDALDGTMARLRGEATSWGAFVDSVSDRYAELLLLGGLMVYYLRQGIWWACALVYLAAVGSIMVSYVKARAESLGYEAKVGILSRLERYIVLVPCLIFNIPFIAAGILAVLANFTAFQRIYYVRQQTHQDETKPE
jgi:CDP-diacylglycerol--glycerol-3-phosphate 3-phosphatidyltransferase